MKSMDDMLDEEAAALQAIEDRRLARFLEVVEQIPPTWTCIRCHREFPNDLTIENTPIGVQYQDVRQQDGSYRQIKVGDICGDCMG
jgi:hypothetical protein